MAKAEHQTCDTSGFSPEQLDGSDEAYSDPHPRFVITAAESDPYRYLQMDAYSAAMAFVQGKFDVSGDLFEAIRYYFSRQRHFSLRAFLLSSLARLEHLRISSLLGGRKQSAGNIRYHYDVSNEFYSQFLDSRMVYSAASFNTPEDSLDQAQQQKLEQICRDLELAPGEHFADIGCGWGALVIHAAAKFGVQALGCTLSNQQCEFALHTIEQRSLTNNISVRLCDYRDLEGHFDKVASVGMFEHVGRARLPLYFRKAFDLLRPGGLFLNRGVVRPRGVADAPETLFIQKQVFPGGELVHLDEVIRHGERAGFDVIGVRNLRMHYALTCKAWVNNLQKAAARCRAVVGDRTYRTWLLYLAACAVAFADRQTGASQQLFRKPAK